MSQNSDNDPECAVCLQKYLQPVSLPCQHVFCFLCAKGMIIHSRRCALCRQAIPDNYLDKPNVVADTPSATVQGTHKWFYQGHRGWWQYDQRTNNDIEDAFTAKKAELKVMLSGFNYVIDLTRMVQYREIHPQRCRAIKRDICDIPDNKGVAGLSMGLLKGAQGCSKTQGQDGSGNNIGQGSLGSIGQGSTMNVGQDENVGQDANVGQVGLIIVSQGGSVYIGQNASGNVSKDANIGQFGNVGQNGIIGQGRDLGQGGNLGQDGNLGQGRDLGQVVSEDLVQSRSGNIGECSSGYVAQDGLRVISQGGSGCLMQSGSKSHVTSDALNVGQQLSVDCMDQSDDDDDEDEAGVEIIEIDDA